MRILVRVKVCGLTTIQEIFYANDTSPDYVGFVFAKSKRQITVEQARELCFYLKPGIKKVGVFVDALASEVEYTAKQCDLDILQFHGTEDPLYCKSFSRQVWKAFRIENEASLKPISLYQVDGLLLDSYQTGQMGGSGTCFDWQIASGLTVGRPLILAGGLSVINVEQAVSALSPVVVDVSSGVEVDGHKDITKMQEFIQKVRSL